MRTRAHRSLATVLIGGLFVAACGSSTPTASTPVSSVAASGVAPSQHLTEPATADDVIRVMAISGLKIVPNNATSGRNGEPIKSVNATYDGWPIVITQYSSAAALRKVARFDPSKGPVVGDATYVLVGLNILISYGPQIHSRKAPRPAARYRTSAMRIVETLDPVLGPLQQVTVDPLPLPGGAAASPSASTPAASAPAKSPKASPSA
jgi:hypothetical protein